MIINYAKPRKVGRPRKNPDSFNEVQTTDPRPKPIKSVIGKKLVLDYLYRELEKHENAANARAEEAILRHDLTRSVHMGRCTCCGAHLSPDEIYFNGGEACCGECVQYGS